MIMTLSDLGGVVTALRGSVSEVLGYEPSEVLGRRVTDFVHPSSMAAAVENWTQLVQNPGHTRTSRRLWVRKDGSNVWLESNYLVHDDSTIEVLVVDISARMADEQALAASRAEVEALAEDFRLVADEVPMPVFRCDLEGRLEFRNAQWSETFPDQPEGDRLHDVLHLDDHGALDTHIAELIEGLGAPRVFEGRAADGARVLSIRCRAVGGESTPTRIVGSFSDITATVELRHLATHDSLTGLANRQMIETQLADALATDPAGTLVVFIDLDGFKNVNDDHGHDAGDVVLRQIADRLDEAVRPGDHVGRYGGDEFVLVCHGVSDAGADVIAERLVGEAFTEPVEFDGGTWAPLASIGWARPAADADVAAVLRRADQAMFEVKRQRRAAAASHRAPSPSS
ncbi:MAG: sensor domain-containing diguanylate cyclase [Acidimicrobiia bacterium]|nr:sensor domain-containing diguanylate cyclase [Acidimicrobiia bacterium]